MIFIESVLRFYLVLIWCFHNSLSDSVNTTQTSSLADYHYCENVNIVGSDIETEFENLKRCHVIEGHLRLHRCTLPDKASLPNLTQVTDYIILERVIGLESLADLFPRLSVIRGQNLFLDRYAFVLHSNLWLEEIGPWSLEQIIHGAVHVKDNVLLCTDEKIHWNNLVRYAYQEFNNFHNNYKFCPFIDCEKEGYCTVRKKTCNSSGLTCADVPKENCSSECVGGCYKPSDPSYCVACKNYEYYEGEMSDNPIRKCVKKCPAGYLNYLNYRCISYNECHGKNWTILHPKDTEFLDEEFVSTKDLTLREKKIMTLKEKKFNKYKNDTKCIKHCPQKFIEHRDDGSIRICKLRRVCETTTITNRNLAENLRFCEHIDGNLIILVTGGINVMQKLEQNLKKIKSVSGYVKIAGANALFSLSFFRNLKRIQGSEKINGKYSLYLIENSNLRQLWGYDFTTNGFNITITGSVYIHFNDRLCDSEIGKFRQVANIIDGSISNDTNGINAPCKIFHTNLNAMPGSGNGSILLSWMHTFCGVDSRYVYGYNIFYRPVTKNISKYQERDVCNDDKLWQRNVVELKNILEPMCISMELKCLTPNTIYAIYIQSHAVDNIKIQIESDIVYAKTYNDKIDKPNKGKLELKNDDMLLSWEPPKIPGYVVLEEIFYEILISLDADDNDVFENALQNEAKEATAASEVKKTNCHCRSFNKNTFFLHQQKKESISIANEISSLVYRRRERRSTSQLPDDDEEDSCDGLTYKSIPSPSKYRSKACDAMRAEEQDCGVPRVNWASSSSLRFKRAISKSQWKLKDNVYRKSERTQNTSIFLSLPDSLQLMPKKISVEIRACVGEISPCEPLNITEESCSMCSDFRSLTFLTLDKSSLPKFEVKLWQSDSNSSGLKRQYTSWTKTQRPTHCIDRSWMDILKELENESGQFRDEELSNISMMPFRDNDSSLLPLLNISWTEPSDFLNFILGYRIIYYSMDGNEKSGVRIYIPKSVAEETGNRFKIPVETSSKKYVGFQIKYKGGYGQIGQRCLTINVQNETSGLFLYLIWFSFVVLGILSMFAVCKFSKAIYSLYLDSNFLKEMKKREIFTNNYYGAYLDRFEEKYRIEPNQLKIEDKELGKGGFGKVFKALYKVSDDTAAVIPVAVKVIKDKPDDKIKLSDQQQFLQEADIMQKLDCFFVVKLIGICGKGPDRFGYASLCIAMELMDDDLKHYLTQNKNSNSLGNTSDNYAEIFEIMIQVSDAMLYLFEKRIIHRDLAARNCFVQFPTSEGPSIIVKVGDFGLARSLNDHDLMYVPVKNIHVPVRSTAPEGLTMNCYFTCKSDVFSFGCLIYEIVTCDQQYMEYSNMEEVKEKIIMEGIRLNLPSDCPSSIKSLFNSCILCDSSKRPTFTEIVQYLVSPEFASDKFLSWFKCHSHFRKCGSMDSKKESLNEVDDFSASTTLEHCDTEMDEESDYFDNDCLAPKECERNHSSCLSINCVHHTFFNKRNKLSK